MVDNKTDTEIVREIIDLLYEEQLLAAGERVELDIVRDLRNVLADRRLFLKQRNDNQRYSDVLFELHMRGLALECSTVTPESAGAALDKLRNERDQAIGEARQAKQQVRALRDAIKGILE